MSGVNHTVFTVPKKQETGIALGLIYPVFGWEL